MKRFLSLVAVVALARAELAQAQPAYPFAGTWIVNASKTGESNLSSSPKNTYPKNTYLKNTYPKSTQIEVAVDRGAYRFSFTGSGPDGKGPFYSFSFPVKGGRLALAEGFGRGYTGAATLPRADTAEVELRRDGKVVLKSHMTVDGKTLTTTHTGTDGDGRPFRFVEVFSRLVMFGN